MKFLQLFSLYTLYTLNGQSIEVRGIVVDVESQTPLVGVNIVSGETGTITDIFGTFIISAKTGSDISFSFIGYEKINTIVKPKMTILMTPTILQGDVITVTAIRAIRGMTPVSFSNLTAKEIETRNTAQDVPMMLASEPGV